MQEQYSIELTFDKQFKLTTNTCEARTIQIRAVGVEVANADGGYSRVMGEEAAFSRRIIGVAEGLERDSIKSQKNPEKCQELETVLKNRIIDIL